MADVFTEDELLRAREGLRKRQYLNDATIMTILCDLPRGYSDIDDALRVLADRRRRNP